MTDMYRKMFYPTIEELIAGYEKAIQKKEEEIAVWKAYVQKLKDQAVLVEMQP